MKTASKLPWADAKPKEPPPKRAGEYELCPRCETNWMRCTSEFCSECSIVMRALRNRMRSVVRKFVYGKGRVRFEFRDGSVEAPEEGTLYTKVTVEWTCRQDVVKSGEWQTSVCMEVFTTEEYTDAWILRDAEAICPSCGSTLKLGKCEARLL